MHHFTYKNGELFAEDVSLGQIAKEVGTPTYVYSRATLERHFMAFQKGFEGLDHLICFAVKSNTTKAVINLFASLGGGADIVSGGEMARAIAAGVEPEKIVYSGVGKTEAEMEAALEAGILMFNAESSQELDILEQVAGRMGKKAPVSIRVNPDVDAKTHPKITTGMANNKFGLPMEEAFKAYKKASASEHLEVRGVSCHIGSQLTDVTPFADSLARLSGLVERLRAEGMKVSILDLGGGLGITYNQENPPEPGEYAAALKETVSRLGVKLVLEPGRVLVGNAGVLLAKVLFTKATDVKNFVVVDAAMNDLIRPAMYDSYHGILPVKESAGGTIKADVVGPICETGDFIARDRDMPAFKRGELMAVMSAGAYGFAMSSTYNSRPRAAEVMVSKDRWSVVRRRETVDELSRGEALPDWVD